LGRSPVHAHAREPVNMRLVEIEEGKY